MRNKLTALTGFRFAGRAPRVLPVIALLAGALFLAACGGGGGGPPAAEEPAPSCGGALAGPIERVSLHSDGTEAAGVCKSTFLRNAAEISGDDIGNDNLLCESGEECLYSPNMGSYQGEGALILAASIGTGGTVQNVTLWRHVTNGN